MFTEVKSQVKAAFDAMVLSGATLFTVNVDKDLLWNTYLENFSDETKQQHNCNCCRQFIKNYGGIVTITPDLQLKTVWDFIPTDEEYTPSVEALGIMVRNASIRNQFINDFANLGTDKNYDMERQCTWEHFHVVAPKSVIVKKDQKDRIWGQLRTNKELFMRAMTELTVDAAETVLDLIAQNSLYRGKEFEPLVQGWLNEKRKWEACTGDKELYAWRTTPTLGQSLISLRNSAIGTLLVDLSEGVDLDKAVTGFERMVAPTNYKRPTALITKSMIDDAENKLKELGLTDSLGRRYATPEDISVENVLFVNRDAKAASSVFEEMKEETTVSPKTFSKVEEVTIDNFIKDILPNASSVELLVENSHLPNLVSLIAPQQPEAPGLFKWSNPFSWCYVNALTDSMKERVKEAGGNVEGVLRFSIQWNEDGKSIVDFDAHAKQPDGTEIYYCNFKGRPTSMTGMLDVDMVNPSHVGVENITWTNKEKMAEGTYRFWIRNYNSGRNNGFSAQIEFDGQIFEFSKAGNIKGDTQIAEVYYSKKDGFTIKPLMEGYESRGNVVSKEKWGISTNQFRKVSMIMHSPNHWTDKILNKHTFFVLEGAKSDEPARGFFNEFLKPELETNRKVFEVLGGKLRVEPSDRQVTGLGFSETQRNSVICRVNGKFQRTIKLLF